MLKNGRRKLFFFHFKRMFVFKSAEVYKIFKRKIVLFIEIDFPRPAGRTCARSFAYAPFGVGANKLSPSKSNPRRNDLRAAGPGGNLEDFSSLKRSTFVKSLLALYGY